MDAPLFKLDTAHYTYDDGTVALDGVSLELFAREKVVILGANGAGKSTLLKILDGLIFPQRGHIYFRGKPLSDEAFSENGFNAAFRSSVAMVFQNPDAQLFCSTVWEEIAFGPQQLGMDEAETNARVRETLSLFRLEALASRPPYHLSGGEKKRVSLAAAWAVDPDILLLDEPTAALDPRSKWELIDLLLKLHEHGKTLVTATHDMEIVEIIGDRLLILGEDKRVLRSGAASEILQDSALLERANLIHNHAHRHDGMPHRHAHIHKTEEHH
jgi:cobalt/nickel transport system ATP-binding protein